MRKERGMTFADFCTVALSCLLSAWYFSRIWLRVDRIFFLFYLYALTIFGELKNSEMQCGCWLAKCDRSSETARIYLKQMHTVVLSQWNAAVLIFVIVLWNISMNMLRGRKMTIGQSPSSACCAPVTYVRFH